VRNDKSCLVVNEMVHDSANCSEWRLSLWHFGSLSVPYEMSPFCDSRSQRVEDSRKG
jgi:hypothetical protein